ncbi:3'-5' exonuclease [Ligilactobacillus pabuli]|uniref:3'-5' exonuclease DinG n=1 Tax=Ligilactobacillus pabuli TaxID=2886039 RepID=A0ABQ5JEW2_9LACO|nr:helicase C-terminal domain-containing protein [Ligilactobacillus pabuli]GKS80383.1 3'-5' exonuclease [Ligilactobacillus pabuli]
MSSQQIYAVVDLETTGTAINGTNRIIQFSCTFVQNQQIVNEFSTLVDPKQPIPAEISQLTNIKDKDVRKAPSFEEIAGTVYSLLQNTVFVAHNIAFDYNFLSSELVRVGYPELDLQGIDTVQLAQIVLPTLPSYRLSDVSQFLDLKHDQPHNAASDAQTTAVLLIKLQNKIADFPVTLLEKLTQMGRQLEFETGDCFKAVYDKKRKLDSKLPANLMSVGGIILQRPVFSKDSLAPLDYPTSLAEKEKLFTNSIEVRSAQVSMMDEIAVFFNSDEQVRTIDAPTGMGKTLGYLFPAAYQVGQGKQIVLSTATTALQSQLRDHDFPLLKDVLPFGNSIVSLKGMQHFIDLERFIRSLKKSQNSHTNVLQMRILVWLMQTKTGDFDELHITKMQDPIFSEIRHHGIENLDRESPFYAVDFLRRQKAAEKNADFILTNHAYLSHHVAELAGPQRILIVDEAQHLAEMTRKSNRRVLDLDEIKILADSLLVKLQSHESYSFVDLVDANVLTAAEFKELVKLTRVIDFTTPQLSSEFEGRFVRKIQPDEYYEKLIEPMKMRGFIKAHLAEFTAVAKAYRKLNQANRRLYQNYVMQTENLHLSSVQRRLLDNYFTLTDSLEKELRNWELFDLDQLEALFENQLIWLTKSGVPGAHLRLNSGLMETKGFLQEQIYSAFEHTLLIGASLSAGSINDYVRNSLDLPADSKISGFQSAFNYEKQVQALVAADAPDVGQVDYRDYCEYLAETIAQISEAVPRQTLVLFNSLQTIEDVYHLLQHKKITNMRNVLAQGISGGVEKVKKRFIMDHDHHALLLGTGSFWEGIDLPQDDLELLIITRLPFQPVASVVNQARYHRVEQLGENPFSKIALPEAVLKLNQGFGRLIRTPQDRGAFVLLDSRILTKKYGVVFEKALPQGVDLKQISSQEIPADLQTFFKNDPR